MRIIKILLIIIFSILIKNQHYELYKVVNIDKGMIRNYYMILLENTISNNKYLILSKHVKYDKNIKYDEFKEINIGDNLFIKINKLDTIPVLDFGSAYPTNYFEFNGIDIIHEGKINVEFYFSNDIVDKYIKPLKEN